MAVTGISWLDFFHRLHDPFRQESRRRLAQRRIGAWFIAASFAAGRKAMPAPRRSASCRSPGVRRSRCARRGDRANLGMWSPRLRRARHRHRRERPWQHERILPNVSHSGPRGFATRPARRRLAVRRRVAREKAGVDVDVAHHVRDHARRCRLHVANLVRDSPPTTAARAAERSPSSAARCAPREAGEGVDPANQATSPIGPRTTSRSIRPRSRRSTTNPTGNASPAEGSSGAEMRPGEPQLPRGIDRPVELDPGLRARTSFALAQVNVVGGMRREPGHFPPPERNSARRNRLRRATRRTAPRAWSP